jgi:hypothetical protein
MEDRIAVTLKAAGERIEVGEGGPAAVRLDPSVPRETPRWVAFAGAFGAVLLVALALSLIGPAQSGPTGKTASITDGPGELVHSAQPGRGTAEAVQEMVVAFSSNVPVKGTVVEVGRVRTPMGLASLVRWTTVQGGDAVECYGWIREQEGTEVCGLPRLNQGPMGESTTDDIPIELRIHAIFLEVPEDVQAVKVTTADGSVIISPVMGRLALAEWQGHGTAHCIVGMRDDGSTFDFRRC